MASCLWSGYDVTADFKGGATVPIGQPIANLRCYILDARLQLVPVGVPGELMVSGIQLARGYLKRPDLTAEKFIANPFSDGDPHHNRLYRTGMHRHWRPCLTVFTALAV
jgi:non-ribosomal peptide synthetase component F